MILVRPSGPDRFHVSLPDLPVLNDHRVQGAAVLPGAAYVEMAAAPGLAAVEFLQPILVGPEPTEIVLDRTEDGMVTFRDAQSASAAARMRCLAVAGDAAPGSRTDRVLREPHPGASTYQRLSASGNAYGPAFQRILESSQDGDLVLARLSSVPGDDPILVDAAVQVAALRHLDQGKTYVWQGAERIESFAVATGATWRVAAHGNDVTVRNDAGDLRLRLTGVRLSLLEQEAPAEPWVVAATFTAEPLEDPLRFWSRELHYPFSPQFAPYNQIFQELLSPDSAFRRNSAGTNLMLVDLEDWLPAEPPPVTLRASAPLAGAIARAQLPNGAEIAHLNRHETDYVYREIFEDRCYLRHGISLPANATVIDIGANIGLFSLFVRAECPGATVHAFEPSPLAFAALAANCAAFGPNLHPHHAGVSDHRGQAALTFYPESSVFSSFHPDEAEDRQAIQAVVANVVRGELQGSGVAVDEVVSDLTTRRLEARTFDCPLLSVSDLIRDENLTRIHLLKIDAEKCEREILRGIADADWAKIEQLVIEVHDRSRALLNEVCGLLEARGFHCAVEEETLLEGSGLFNVYARREAAVETSSREADLQAKADDLARAVEAYSAAGGAPALLAVVPRRTEGAPRERLRALDRTETRLLERLAPVARVQTLRSDAIESSYPVARYRLPAGQVLGHVPLAPEGYAALGTALVRARHAQRRAPLKVVAADCDGTLWRGVCGEDGAHGVIVTPAHRALQEALVRLADRGVLICLCSKNRAEDVWAVFETNPGMVLRRDQIATSRIDWTPKSANLRALAAELNLGIDAVALLDDNPVECAEVAANCPEAIALQLPEDSSIWIDWLRHLWLFDATPKTAEDARRTELLRENSAREAFRGHAGSLAEFIAGLQLRVEIAPAKPDDLPRLAQLTQRTNQFNLTTRRRTEAELDRFLTAEGGQALAVRVSDRFGDYGLVGLVLFHAAASIVTVDTFLLSCRVLGRGVEHQVIAELGRRADEAGADTVELRFAASERNEPAAAFYRELGGGSSAPSLRLRSATLQGLTYQPQARAASPVEAPAPHPRPSQAMAQAPFGSIAASLREPAAIAAAVDRFRLGGQSVDDGLPDTLTGKLLRIWRRILGKADVGADQNFFEAGGTSLRAVQVVAAVHRDLGLPLSVAELFERPTVQALVQQIESGSGPDAVGSARERGARRKQRLQRIRI